MRIQVGFDIELGVWAPTSIIYMLRIHPSRRSDIVVPEQLDVTGGTEPRGYVDSYGNLCGRVDVPEIVDGVRFVGSAVVQDSGQPDRVVLDAVQHDLPELPHPALQFLLPSRYCDVDSELMQIAWDNFEKVEPGWRRVQAISDYVNDRLTFDYQQARRDRTALDAHNEQVGVCRDFTHLFVTLCRAMNIPTRYCTGYLGDIGVPADPNPMDFSAWAEVFLGGEWHVFDARHNERRIGRIKMAHGRDAADVPITMNFGPTTIKRFDVTTYEVDEAGNRVDG